MSNEKTLVERLRNLQWEGMGDEAADALEAMAQRIRALESAWIMFLNTDSDDIEYEAIKRATALLAGGRK